jgi:hypothetical protein
MLRSIRPKRATVGPRHPRRTRCRLLRRPVQYPLHLLVSGRSRVEVPAASLFSGRRLDGLSPVLAPSLLSEAAA